MMDNNKDDDLKSVTSETGTQEVLIVPEELRDVRLSSCPPTPTSKPADKIPDKNPTLGRKALRFFGYPSDHVFFEDTLLSTPQSTQKQKLSWPGFFKRHWRLLLGTALAIFFLILAFTPAGHAIACFFVVKAVMGPLCEALMQSSVSTKIIVGISAVLVGYALPFIDFLTFVPLWCAGMALKATAKIADGCFQLLRWLWGGKNFAHTFIFLGKVLLSTFLTPLFFIFTLLANLGDKVFRHVGVSYANRAWEEMTHRPVPAPAPRKDVGFYNDYIIQDLKHMSYDVFQPTQNPNDYIAKPR